MWGANVENFDVAERLAAQEVETREPSYVLRTSVRGTIDPTLHLRCAFPKLDRA